MARSLPAALQGGAAPLSVLLPFALTNSFAAGTISGGVYFIAKSAYHVTVVRSAALGLVFGLGYILGAGLAGRAVRAFVARRPGTTTRGAIGAVVLALSLVALLPALVHHEAALWVMLALYAPLCGVLWPLVENYLSGGRDDLQLKSAVGRFSLGWSGMLVLSFLVLAKAFAHHPFLVLGSVACLHALSLVLLPRLAPEPGRHLDSHAPPPPGSRRLLHAHRVLLAASYLVMYALLPLLPTLLDRLRVPPEQQTPLTAVWLASRVLTFWLLERRTGWHGKASPALIGAAATFGGFALAVLAPGFDAYALPLFTMGLVAFGAGVAYLYYAALDYALRAASDVEAGGTHEAMIGIGYTVGPLLGLGASGLAHAGVVAPEHRDVTMIVAVAVLCVVALCLAARSLFAGARRAQEAGV